MARLALALLLLPPLSGAQASRLHVTELGRRVLSRSDQVVVARVAAVQPPFRGVSTVRLEVQDHLQGYDRSSEILLLFIEDYVAPDAFTATLERATVRFERRPGTDTEGTDARPVGRTREEAGTGARAGAGVRLAKGEVGLFFLSRSGASYRLVGYVPEADPLFQAKRDRLAEVLRLESLSPLDVRVQRAMRFYLDGLGRGSVWERANSARELMGLARRYPKAFGDRDAGVLAGRLQKEKEPAILASLERAVQALDPALALAYAEAEEERERARFAETIAAEKKAIDATRAPELKAADVVRLAQRYGRAATASVAGYLRDDAPLVRERAAQALGETGGPSCRGPLREALRTERDPDAAAAMVYALGLKSDPEAVEVVAARLGDPALERPAIHALARIGTGAARAALEGHRKRADASTAELIGNLLEEEF